ncbi:unnamed protein product [Prorocentrum cordatum]|uniref:Pentatricopeptide repeat-containing protein, chloroplastic n=1 Tax=Prorocentrum cordatum TaxID=2364126 RepID=A0ABN9TAL9_9DINO|nr:unnamed protein product [Polarella glacialis]
MLDIGRWSRASPSKRRSRTAVGQNNGLQHCGCSAKKFDWVCNSSPATTLQLPPHAGKAGNGNTRCQCSVRCGRRSWNPTPISYNAGISACEKGEQWQRALALLSEMWEAKLEPDVIFSYSAGISACAKGEQWHRALALLSEKWEAKLELDVSYSAGISACEKGEQWQWALALLSEMWVAKLEPDSATALGSARATRANGGSGRSRC